MNFFSKTTPKPFSIRDAVYSIFEEKMKTLQENLNNNLENLALKYDEDKTSLCNQAVTDAISIFK